MPTNPGATPDCGAMMPFDVLARCLFCRYVLGQIEVVQVQAMCRFGDALVEVIGQAGQYGVELGKRCAQCV